MLDFIPILSTVLPIIASTLLILVVVFNLYFKIRRKFPINVNCWFCNSWTKVAYDDRNSFDCPTCLQYNGFTKDGDYNKSIPEQHDELMNNSMRVKSKKSTVSNGLCALCNNNQQLKVFQLAHFVPLNEENYDIEIEHFQKQLEKAYKLCKKCDRVLKKTLHKQNAWIFGNRLKNMCSNGIYKVTEQIKKENKSAILTKLDGCLTILLVFAVIFITLSSFKNFTKNLSLHLPHSYLPIYKNIVSFLNTSKIFTFNLFAPYFTRNIKIEPYSIFCGIGLLVQVTKMLFGYVKSPTTVNNLLCWIILFLISWIRFSKNFSTYILFIEAFSCIYLLSTAFTKDEDKKQSKKTAGKTIRKLVKNLEYTCTDFSDVSDFENISSSSKNCRDSSKDSIDFLKSTHSTLDVPLQNNYNLTTAGNVLNPSFGSKNLYTNFDADINKSFNNLHLGGFSCKSPKSVSVASFAVKRPKPVLSPPKFQNVNSWVAGGFWKDSDGVLMPVTQRTNLSRSSSESSGFGSQNNENLQFIPSRPYGDFDRLSEFSRLSPTPTFPFSQSDLRKNHFYPNTNIFRMGSPGLIKLNDSYQRPNIDNWSEKINLQATQSFKDLSLRSNY